MKNARLLRENKKITQEQVAEYLGITRTAYNRYENGNREPSLDQLVKLADYFECSIDYLIGRTKNPLSNIIEVPELKEAGVTGVESMGDLPLSEHEIQFLKDILAKVDDRDKSKEKDKTDKLSDPKVTIKSDTGHSTK